MIIKSADNKKFKLYKSLLGKKGINENNLCLVMGRKIVPELINDKANVIGVIATEKNSELLPSKDIELCLLQKELFNEIDITGTDYPILLFKTPVIEKMELDTPPKNLEILTALGEPNNLGALLRSARAFNVEKVILLKEACHPFLPKVIKTSSGESLKAPIVYGPSLQNLTDQSFYSLDKSGVNINTFVWPKNLRLLLGEEGPGFPDSITPIEQLSIPMNNSVESLNASHVCTLAMFTYQSTFQNL